MADTYKHGVYVQEQATRLIAPVLGTAGLQVIVGTAPVNMLADPAGAVNTPLLVQSYKEAVAAVGYSDDFAAYTLCESISANFQVVGTGPLVLINVLDPSNTKFQEEVAEKDIELADDVALVEETGLLPKELKVKTGGTEATDLTADTDYTTTFNNDGTLTILLTSAGKEKLEADSDAAGKIKVSGKKLDPSKVTAQDIIGTVDVGTGKETGLEVVRQIYPKLGMTPGILLAPRFSAKPEVSAALQAKTHEINGVFSAVTIIDVDSSAEGATKYTDVKEQKEGQALTNPNAFPVWLYGKVGETMYSGSTLAAALTAYTDAVNGDVPNVSPSNKTLAISAVCLADGTEVLLDQTQANTVNSFGVATFLNMNGFRLWGNNTACYPGNTDPKDRWFSVRRFFCWSANTFILTYFQKVDDPMNPRLIEAIVDSENVRGHSFVARDICARYEIEFNEDENPTTDLLNGKITFHQYLTPYVPAEDIENILEFDPDALSALFA
ncbi:phage tail sheath family protein [uncultured Dysosmobacter sp.]|uniref:phage tail sheath family protein n=1 Tax=uncultured Dysosmobacter sp. TaxID=2591384 RepID=UPI00262746BF|nr:phage tail sheath family protein [uncultured Dysosmobacter sp.]